MPATSAYKVLLVNPPVSVSSPRAAIMPLPLLLIGRIIRNLRDQGLPLACKLLDLDLALKRGEYDDSVDFHARASRAIVAEAPDACLITVHGLNLAATLQLCEHVKRLRPHTLIVLGGVAPTLQARDIIEHFECVDVVIKGEAETSVPTLLTQALAGGDFAEVPSAVFRGPNGVIENARKTMAPDDPYLVPDYDLVDMSAYLDNNKKSPYIFPGFALIESGRGCAHRCAFCAPAKMWASQVRYRPIPEIVSEMRFLKQRGFDFSFFTQDNLDAKFLRELASTLVREQVDIDWGGYARIDWLDDDTLTLLQQARCKLVFVGLETPNKSSQKVIRKVMNREKMLAQVRRLNERGILVICSFIAGFDDETPADLANTLEFALECATSTPIAELCDRVRHANMAALPTESANFCMVHPLASMPGTDFANEVKERVHLSEYTWHHDAHGSTLFGLDAFTREHWEHTFNAYTTSLSEQQVLFYYPHLRLFNFLNARPFHFAALLSRREPGALLDVLGALVEEIGVKPLLTATMQQLESLVGAALSRALGHRVVVRAERVAASTGRQEKPQRATTRATPARSAQTV